MLLRLSVQPESTERKNTNRHVLFGVVKKSVPGNDKGAAQDPKYWQELDIGDERTNAKGYIARAHRF